MGDLAGLRLALHDLAAGTSTGHLLAAAVAEHLRHARPDWPADRIERHAASVALSAVTYGRLKVADHDIGGEPLEVAAEHLGASVATVRRHLMTARRAREHFSPEPCEP